MTEHDGRAERERVLERIEEWRRRPLRLNDEVVTLAHGAGGKASQALVQAVVLPAFGMDGVATDGAVIDQMPGRIVMTTDSFVVTPRRFAGGSIATLAVNGTVNDLAVMGAVPHSMSVAFVLEEGLAMDEFRDLVAEVAASAASAGVRIVTGDTKVVERGAADGVYITTTGIGFLHPSVSISHDRVLPGDRIVLSGNIGDHGVAVLEARGDLEITTGVQSDCASIAAVAADLLGSGVDVKWMRDPTRGGVASSLNELAADTSLGVRIREDSLPVSRKVAGVCELLGLDPLYVANEGKLIAVVSESSVSQAVEVMRRHSIAEEAREIGIVSADHPGMVVLETLFGGTRIVDMLVGDPLPRIC